MHRSKARSGQADMGEGIPYPDDERESAKTFEEPLRRIEEELEAERREGTQSDEEDVQGPWGPRA
jgi:hypothetical protein